jgi:hypothetical protein
MKFVHWHQLLRGDLWYPPFWTLLCKSAASNAN